MIDISQKLNDMNARDDRMCIEINNKNNELAKHKLTVKEYSEKMDHLKKQMDELNSELNRYDNEIKNYWCPVKLFDEFSLYKFTGQPMS